MEEEFQILYFLNYFACELWKYFDKWRKQFLSIFRIFWCLWASINMKHLYYILQIDVGNLHEQIYIILPLNSHLLNYWMEGYIKVSQNLDIFIQFRYLLAGYILILGAIRSLNIEPQRAQGTWGTTPLSAWDQQRKIENRQQRMGAGERLGFWQFFSQAKIVALECFYLLYKQKKWLNDLTRWLKKCWSRQDVQTKLDSDVFVCDAILDISIKHTIYNTEGWSSGGRGHIHQR